MNMLNKLPQWQKLVRCQRQALEHVMQLAAAVSDSARADIKSVMGRVAVDERVYAEAIDNIRVHGRIALHFHPERLGRDGLSVAAGLLRSGIYKNQFETGLSSGSPSAFVGGERDAWEQRLFGGAYDAATTLTDRPRYGALQVMNHPDGPAPRFGSCCFLLHPEVSMRSSFTFGGSHEDLAVSRTGTLQLFEPVMAPLLKQLEQGGGAFGVSDLSVVALLNQLNHGLANTASHLQTGALGRALDSFIEAQVHDTIHLDRDVARLVVDPAFQDHPVGATLAELSIRYGIPLAWHSGFALAVDKVPQVFRGYPVRRLAERIARDGVLNAANIGAMANSLQLEPHAWKDWASYEDTLTQFRRLWHVLVLYGTAIEY